MQMSNVGTAPGYGRIDVWLDENSIFNFGPSLLNPNGGGIQTGKSLVLEEGQHIISWSVVPVMKVGSVYEGVDGAIHGNCTFVTTPLPEGVAADIMAGDEMYEICEKLDEKLDGSQGSFQVQMSNVGTAPGYGRIMLS